MSGPRERSGSDVERVASRYAVRPDGSCYIVFGDVNGGPHCQADCDLPEKYVKLLVDAYNGAPRAASTGDVAPTKGQRKWYCKTCDRRLKSLAGLHQHKRDKHGAEAASRAALAAPRAASTGDALERLIPKFVRLMFSARNNFLCDGDVEEFGPSVDVGNAAYQELRLKHDFTTAGLMANEVMLRHYAALAQVSTRPDRGRLGNVF